MDRTQAANYATVAGKRAFVNEDLGAAITGTEADANDAQAWQEELLGVIEGAGLDPDHANLKQVIQGIARIAGGVTTPVTGATTLTLDKAGLVMLDASGGAFTVGLPAANALSGRPIRYQLARKDGSANLVSLAAAGSDTFVPPLAPPQLGTGSRWEVVSDGISAWYLLPYLSSALPGPAFFSTSGTVTIPIGVYRAKVTLVGGGASGASCDGSLAGGAGGAGGVLIKWLDVFPGTAGTVTIGAGGAAPAAGAVNGNDGADTTLLYAAITYTAHGGTHGVHGGAPNGGVGGSASGGDVNLPGSYGGDGSPGSAAMGGNGAPGWMGAGGGRGGSGGGEAASSYGAGGGGAYNTSSAGGAGFQGLALFEWLAK